MYEIMSDVPPEPKIWRRPDGPSYFKAKVGRGLPKILEISISGLPKI